jgi:hypothetical protein
MELDERKSDGDGESEERYRAGILPLEIAWRPRWMLLEDWLPVTLLYSLTALLTSVIAFSEVGGVNAERMVKGKTPLQHLCT